MTINTSDDINNLIGQAYEGALRSIPIVQEERRKEVLNELQQILLPNQVQAHENHIMVGPRFFEVNNPSQLGALETILREIVNAKATLQNAARAEELLKKTASS